MPTSPSHGSPHGSKSLIVQQSCCPGREAPGKQQQRGTGLSEPPWKRHQPQETKLPLLSLSQPAPPATGGEGGVSPGGLQTPLPRWPQPGQGVFEPASAPPDRPLTEPFSPHNTGQHPTRAPTQRQSLSWGTASSSGAKQGGTQASDPRRGQPPAEEPCCAGHGSAPTHAGTAQPGLGQDGTPAQPSWARRPCSRPAGYF